MSGTSFRGIALTLMTFVVLFWAKVVVRSTHFLIKGIRKREHLEAVLTISTQVLYEVLRTVLRKTI